MCIRDSGCADRANHLDVEKPQLISAGFRYAILEHLPRVSWCCGHKRLIVHTYHWYSRLLLHKKDTPFAAPLRAGDCRLDDA